MSRLTEKVNYGSSWVETIETDEYIPLNYSTDTTIGKCVDKLGKLEDLEEELGCPLEVMVKAISNGIYVKDLPREDLIKQFGLKLSNIQTEWYLSNNIMCVNLKDYKQCFWLKKDKSE